MGTSIIKPSKYRNVKTSYAGFLYDSKKEAAYAQRLDIFKKASGKMRVLKVERQVRFPVVFNGIQICVYILDFKVEYPDRIEYVDVKGVRTPEYKLKKKLIEAQYGFVIKEA